MSGKRKSSKNNSGDNEETNENYLLSLIKNELGKLSNSLNAKLTVLEQSIDSIREGQSSIVNSLSFLNEKFEEMKLKAEKIEKENRELKEQNICLQKRFSELTFQLNELDQYHRRVNLEVAGVPERQGEVPERIVLNIAKHISPELAASDFDVVHRLGSKRQADNKARPIIVRFTTRRARNIMYDGRRKLKTLSTKDLGYNSDGKIYLNENLIASTKELMKDVNKARRDAGYKFLWTQNGRIYVLSLKDIHSNMRNRVLIPVTVLEEDVDFPVTITIVQKGKLDVAIHFAFVFNSSDDEDQDPSVEIASSVRAIRGISGTDIQDVELHSIAEMMSVNHFYDLGIALGFRIPNLDAIEYMQSGNRQQAMYQMLVKWRQAQPPGLAAKDALLSVMESLDLPSEDMQISDLGSDSDIQDSTLLTLSKTIKANQFYEVGQLLGLTKMDLQHIKHRTFSNQKDANIQMLYKWKSSQISAEKGMQTLKLVWESIQAVGKTESSEDIMDKGDSARLYQVQEENEPGGPTCESEDMDVICTDMDARGGSPVKYERSYEDPDLHGGMSNTEELCSVALPVKSLPQVCLLGKSLYLDDGVIVEIIDLQRLAVLHSIARQILDIWWHGLKEDERKNQSSKLLLEYNITKIKEGREDVLGAIRSTADLLTLCHRVKVSPSRVLQIMSASVTLLPSYVIGRVVMKMLNLWLQKCGTRDRLLAIAQAFRFNDAATKIAEALESQPSYPKFSSHCNIDHRGGTLALAQLGVALSIPEGAIPKGTRSVVTLQVSTHDTPRIPLREGEVLVTPVIETSFKQELLKPCKVVLPHCINLRGRSGDYSTILYAKQNPRTFGRRSLTRGTSNTSKSEIVFHTRHLQVLALSSSDCPGVQLRCVVFQPTILTPEEEPRLRVYIVHPYRIYMKHISRKERTSSVSYCQVQKEFQFSIQPTSKHLKIILQDGGKVQKRMMPIKGILSGECDPLIFKLQFSAEEKGYKDLNITIQEDRKLTAEKQISISIEDEPDYAVDNITDSHQHFASNNLLEVLADVIREPKDLTSLGYQLGFSQQSMRKYNDPAEVSFDTISRSGFIGMLREWRRRVRPSEQMEELHLALQNAGLEYVTNVILREMGGASRKKFEQLKQEWESRSKKISH
ncbi:uncharacterized protein LOC121406325 [Lytechinus variegatus]|uniref:uncharacterized protein LOC121406325 n=1 Tax=Lytechinus variegatus TaxID=7654 RepID=UPI001BB26885|nr:uncharacterized protein LOC121406325 [Lytechinus variegatus]